MRVVRGLQFSLLMAVVPVFMGLQAYAAESQAASEASASPASNAQVEGSSEASLKTSSESARASTSGAATESSSDASGPSRAVNVINQPVVRSGGPVVKNIGVVPSRQKTTTVQKSSAHWKTQVWNKNTAVIRKAH